MANSSKNINLSPEDPASRVLKVRIRHAEWAFNLAWGMTATSALLGLVGAGLLLANKAQAGAITTAGSTASAVVCRSLAKDANDRLDKLTAQMDDDKPN
ncbi:MAG: hypothetical protein KME15_16640 [Drouetiella hepatica Uher 2000/2452]|jgi:hypothetical protein|uniref:Cyanobacterial TRADD-N associated 2 transmembrane domain-containing protein n=1 Tax=Drouetiella hepatica Uher 2000/2452 TaxID=904376 RepID=A0A951UNY9_9CYAN|nr:hypothetical protein [Drouetiella hepatica Uher 2000/2452]